MKEKRINRKNRTNHIEYPNDRIIIENGDMFEGSRDQFRNCFFDNANNYQIKDWCYSNDLNLKINEEIIIP